MSWEERMAIRARERRVAASRASSERKAVLNTQQPWMNGWPRLDGGLSVLVGTGTHCVCCGKLQGVTCVAFSDDYQAPGPIPTWPFGEDDCPLEHWS